MRTSYEDTASSVNVWQSIVYGTKTLAVTAHYICLRTRGRS